MSETKEDNRTDQEILREYALSLYKNHPEQATRFDRLTCSEQMAEAKSGKTKQQRANDAADKIILQANGDEKVAIAIAGADFLNAKGDNEHTSELHPGEFEELVLNLVSKKLKDKS